MTIAAPPSGIIGLTPGSRESGFKDWSGGYRRPLLAWSLSRARAMFVVTPALRLMDLNEAAEALVKTGGEVQVSGCHLALSDKTKGVGLRAVLEGDAGGAAGWSYRRGCGKIVVVQVEWLPPHMLDDEEPLVALTFQPADPTERYVWADFAPYFDLTRSEAAIARRLVGGQTPSDAAEALGLSIETVRTHIRRIYNKLGISSREQLFSVIASFRVG
ncbi:MAG: helix-turn-helix transcriptional regulator [Brevundimonas sp.]